MTNTNSQQTTTAGIDRATPKQIEFGNRLLKERELQDHVYDAIAQRFTETQSLTKRDASRLIDYLLSRSIMESQIADLL